MRTLLFVFLTAAASGCLPSVYEIIPLDKRPVTITLRDGREIRAPIVSADASSLIIGKMSTATLASGSLTSWIDTSIARSQVLKIVDASGDDITGEYLDRNRGEGYLGRLADLQTRQYNAALAESVISLALLAVVIFR